MNWLWFAGVCVLIQAYEGERVGAFVTADEDSAIGLGGSLDASLDRISSKLQQEKMNRLLSIDDDALTGLLKSHEADDINKDATKPVRSVTTEEPPRLKQVMHTTESTATTLKVLKDQLSTMLAQQASLIAKQETVQKELTEIHASMNKQEGRDHEASVKLDLLKSDIISAVSRSIEQGNKRMDPSSSRFQLPELDELGSKRSVLAALKKTLSDLKSHVLRSNHEDPGLGGNYRFSQRRYPQQQQLYPQLPPWQPFPQYSDGAQKVRRLQDKVMRNQDAWTDAGDPNYVMSVDEEAFAPQGTPLYSDQSIGTYTPDYTS
jgi:hypothetical protein